MNDFQPISLYNTVYKIISKAFSNRLKKILPSLISHHQNAFTTGREVFDNIIYVSEVFNTMQKEKFKGMAIKLDVSKAFDRIIWSFLVHVLLTVGFINEFSFASPL